MENEKIKKINTLYLLGYIFVPIIITALCFWISYLYFPKGNMAVILLMGPSVLSIIWWILGGKLIYKNKMRAFERKLDADGFNRNHTFYGRGATVIVDIKNGKIGLIFFWNPFKTYIVDAKRITNSWVDNGKSGSGFMEGSSRVSFLFTIDKIRIRVDTFTSNQRFRMDSDYILTGISKADMIVKVLDEAASNSK